MEPDKKISDLPLVSIGVTSFNNGRFIRETLDSIVSQTYDNIELIINDDCSAARSASRGSSHGAKVFVSRLAADMDGSRFQEDNCAFHVHLCDEFVFGSACPDQRRHCRCCNAGKNFFVAADSGGGGTGMVEGQRYGFWRRQSEISVLSDATGVFGAVYVLLYCVFAHEFSGSVHDACHRAVWALLPR